jgi:hypothetical protein
MEISVRLRSRILFLRKTLKPYETLKLASLEKTEELRLEVRLLLQKNSCEF